MQPAFLHFVSKSSIVAALICAPLLLNAQQAADKWGNVYIANADENRVRRIAPNGQISLLAGNGTGQDSGDEGLALEAGLSGPESLAVDSVGNLYIGERSGSVRRVDVKTGRITTVLRAVPSLLPSPVHVALDGNGAVLIEQPRAHRVLRITQDGSIESAAWDSASSRMSTLSFGRDAAGPAASLAILAGNDQTGAPGTTLPLGLKILVTDAVGLAVSGVAVTFSVTGGSATLSAATVNTGADGTASVQVTLGQTTGTVTITASAPGLTTQTFTLTDATASGSGNPPQISAGGIVGAALSTPSIQALSPNGIATIFGQNFLPTGTSKIVSTSDLVNGAVPTTLAGVCVQVGGIPAPLFAVFPNQINFQVPALPAGTTVSVQVTTGCNTASSTSTQPVTLSVQAAAPEFFSFKVTATGKNPIAAIDSVSGALLGATGLIPGASIHPAKPGEFVTLFGTGFGLTSPPVSPGQLPTVAASIAGPVTVSLGGTILPTSAVLYTGVTGGNAGLYQVNIQIPANTPAGDLPVVVNINGAASPPAAFLTIQ